MSILKRFLNVLDVQWDLWRIYTSMNTFLISSFWTVLGCDSFQDSCLLESCHWKACQGAPRVEAQVWPGNEWTSGVYLSATTVWYVVSLFPSRFHHVTDKLLLFIAFSIHYLYSHWPRANSHLIYVSIELMSYISIDYRDHLCMQNAVYTDKSTIL